MESVRKLEVTIASWYKSVPHLPKKGQEWLAVNAWWLTLIGVILGALAVVNILFFSLLAGAFLTAIAGPVGAVAGGLVLVGVIISLCLGIVCILLGGMAISPLKALQKKGWTLLFILLLIEVAAIVISDVLSFNLLALVWELLWAAVAGYFLFEIRGQFEAKARKQKEKAAK
ncbi:MAG TPA: hypothetical protein VFH06_03220 [Candidatus Saccharimonadales bacterium]|nr:hypothetical protein [Candidatus Saccharimonadales bacterium]